MVYAKPPFGDARQALEYLGRFTHRVALSYDRLLAVGQHEVTVQSKDYRIAPWRNRIAAARASATARVLRSTCGRSGESPASHRLPRSAEAFNHHNPALGYGLVHCALHHFRGPRLYTRAPAFPGRETEEIFIGHTFSQKL